MDECAFSERTRALVPRLHRIAYLILRSESDCEDAVQEALLRAWRAQQRLRDESLFETWLIRILVNESKRLLNQRIPTVMFSEAHAGVQPNDPGLRDEIRALHIGCRIPLVLHYLEGYTQEEIARLLHLPLATVKWRLHRARKLMREELMEEGEG